MAVRPARGGAGGHLIRGAQESHDARAPSVDRKPARRARALRAIKRYLASREDNLPWLFVSERQAQLTRHAVNYIVQSRACA